MWPTLISAGIGALGSVAGGILGNSATNAAIKAQKKMFKQQLAFEQQGREAAQGLLGPAANYTASLELLRDLAGINGPQRQAEAFGRYQESPEFAFLRDQGITGTERAAAARGQSLSGRTLSDLAKFSEGLAAQGYGDYYSRIRDLLGVGVGAASDLAGAYTGSAARSAGYAGNTGNNLAQLALAKGQNWTNALQGGLGSLAYGIGKSSFKQPSPGLY